MSMMFAVPDGARSDAPGSVDFLRRFADMMSGSANAGKLQAAAELIERLVRQLSETERLARQAEDRCNAYRDLCATAEAAIHELQGRIAGLEERIEAQREASERLVAEGIEEQERLSAAIVQSEAGREDLRRELACRNAELEALSGCSVVPLAAMCAIRDQFRSLADQCEVGGNVVATSMCDIGSMLAEQAISKSRVTSVVDQMIPEIQSVLLR